MITINLTKHHVIGIFTAVVLAAAIPAIAQYCVQTAGPTTGLVEGGVMIGVRGACSGRWGVATCAGCPLGGSYRMVKTGDNFTNTNNCSGSVECVNFYICVRN
jgi:hypothetical protein